MYLEEERGARWMICDNRLEASFKFAKPGRGGGKEKRNVSASVGTNFNGMGKRRSLEDVLTNVFL